MKRESEFRYMKLANVLRDQILSGFIKPGQFLLSENELCRHYGLSRSSVRKALDQLHEEGLIEKRVGQGTVVPPELTLPKSPQKTLKILATSPSYFADFGFPIILRAFKRAFPQVEVKIISLPSSSFGDSFEASREMGFQPDIIFVADRQYQILNIENRDGFQPLDGVLKPEFEAMYPKLAEAFGNDRPMIAAPVSFSTVYLVYNARMFERFGARLPHPAWTREEFLSAAKMLTRDTDGDGILDTCGLSLPTSFARWPTIAMQNGMRFGSADTHVSRLKTLNLLHDLLYRYRVATLAGSALNSEAFFKERTGMVLTTTMEMANWKNNGLPFEPKIAPMPFGPDPSTLLIANAFMVPSQCEDIGLAAEFLRIALSAETQREICKEAPFLSVVPEVNEELFTRDDLAALGILRGDMDNCYFLHELLPHFEVMRALERQMELFWYGLESAESFAVRMGDILQQQPGDEDSY